MAESNLAADEGCWFEKQFIYLTVGINLSLLVNSIRVFFVVAVLVNVSWKSEMQIKAYKFLAN